MSLNKVKGNMYPFITHTWNTIKGACPHACTYCYMKRWGKQPQLHFDERELKTDLGSGNFIFIGSSCDMFARKIPYEWIFKTIEQCCKSKENKYLLQSKNPERFHLVDGSNFVICTTLETNRFYKAIMNNSPCPTARAEAMTKFKLEKYITVEPIIDFDLVEFVEMIKQCEPVQVNIGADSGGHKLPEPPKEKVLELIEKLKTFTRVIEKSNLRRILA